MPAKNISQANLDIFQLLKCEKRVKQNKEIFSKKPKGRYFKFYPEALAKSLQINPLYKTDHQQPTK